MNPDHKNVPATAERIKSAIAFFERQQAALLARRRGAPDAVIVEIDGELEINARTIVALKRSLALIEARPSRCSKPHGGPDESAAPQ